MAKPKNLTGQVFGRLTALTCEKPSKWKCVCSCGKEAAVSSHNLLNGTAKSCGCIRNEKLVTRRTTHGMTNTATYVAWTNMKSRCGNPNYRGYEIYGGRGISVCAEWQDSFETFLTDMGERPEGMSLDRIDTNGNYEKSNCRWATWSDQMNNQRKTVLLTHNGETMSRARWAKRLGVKPDDIRSRIASGMSVSEALSS